VQLFRAIEHDQEQVIERKPTVPKLAQQRHDDPLVLACRLHNPQHSLFPRDGHSQGNDELIAGKRRVVEHQHQSLRIIELPFLKPAEFTRIRADETVRDTRLRKPEGFWHHFWHRFGRGLVLATGEATQHHSGTGLRPARVASAAPDRSPVAPHTAWRNPTPAALRTPFHDGGLRVVTSIARPCQYVHFGDQLLRDRLHPQRDQRLNDREHRWSRHGPIVQWDRLLCLGHCVPLILRLRVSCAWAWVVSSGTSGDPWSDSTLSYRGTT